MRQYLPDDTGYICAREGDPTLVMTHKVGNIILQEIKILFLQGIIFLVQNEADSTCWDT